MTIALLLAGATIAPTTLASWGPSYETMVVYDKSDKKCKGHATYFYSFLLATLPVLDKESKSCHTWPQGQEDAKKAASGSYSTKGVTTDFEKSIPKLAADRVYLLFKTYDATDNKCTHGMSSGFGGVLYNPGCQFLANDHYVKTFCDSGACNVRTFQDAACKKPRVELHIPLVKNSKAKNLTLGQCALSVNGNYFKYELAFNSFSNGLLTLPGTFTNRQLVDITKLHPHSILDPLVFSFFKMTSFDLNQWYDRALIKFKWSVYSDRKCSTKKLLMTSFYFPYNYPGGDGKCKSIGNGRYGKAEKTIISGFKSVEDFRLQISDGPKGDFWHFSIYYSRSCMDANFAGKKSYHASYLDSNLAEAKCNDEGDGYYYKNVYYPSNKTLVAYFYSSDSTCASASETSRSIYILQTPTAKCLNITDYYSDGETLDESRFQVKVGSNW